MLPRERVGFYRDGWSTGLCAFTDNGSQHAAIFPMRQNPPGISSSDGAKPLSQTRPLYGSRSVLPSVLPITDSNLEVSRMPPNTFGIYKPPGGRKHSSEELTLRLLPALKAMLIHGSAALILRPPPPPLRAFPVPQRSRKSKSQAGKVGVGSSTETLEGSDSAG